MFLVFFFYSFLSLDRKQQNFEPEVDFYKKQKTKTNDEAIKKGEQKFLATSYHFSKIRFVSGFVFDNHS